MRIENKLKNDIAIFQNLIWYNVIDFLDDELYDYCVNNHKTNHHYYELDNFTLAKVTEKIHQIKKFNLLKEKSIFTGSQDDSYDFEYYDNIPMLGGLRDNIKTTRILDSDGGRSTQRVSLGNSERSARVADVITIYLESPTSMLVAELGTFSVDLIYKIVGDVPYGRSRGFILDKLLEYYGTSTNEIYRTISEIDDVQFRKLESMNFKSKTIWPVNLRNIISSNEFNPNDFKKSTV
jgi:hypothetical protein